MLQIKILGLFQSISRCQGAFGAKGAQFVQQENP
jgi:hypothetical protein